MEFWWFDAEISFSHWLVNWCSGLKLAQKSNRFHDDSWYTSHRPLYFYQKDIVDLMKNEDFNTSNEYIFYDLMTFNGDFMDILGFSRDSIWISMASQAKMEFWGDVSTILCFYYLHIIDVCIVDGTLW